MLEPNAFFHLLNKAKKVKESKQNVNNEDSIEAHYVRKNMLSMARIKDQAKFKFFLKQEKPFSLMEPTDTLP